MKKSIIALAVAGAMTAPMVAQADATLFGEIRFDITKAKDTDVNSDITRMRLGVKGEETMDNGLTAGYFIRLDATGSAADANLSTHKTTVYVAGDFGKVVMGDTGNPNEGVEDRTEFGLYSGTLTVVDSGFGGGGIAYESNNMNGLAFAAGIGNVDTDDSSSRDASNGVMVSYDTDAFGVTFGAGQNKGLDNKSNYGISATTSFSGVKLGARVNVQKKTGDDLKGYAVGGSYTVDKLTLALQHEATKLGSVKAKMVAVDATYALGGNASVTLAAASFNDDAEAASNKDQVKLRYKITF